MIFTLSEAVASLCPSSTVNVTFSVPNQSGVELMITAIPEKLAIISVLLEIERVKTSPSTSFTYGEKSSTRLLSSANVKLAGRIIVGGSFTGLIVTGIV